MYYIAFMITTSKELTRTSAHVEKRQLQGLQALANYRKIASKKPNAPAGIIREAVEKLLVRELKKAGIEYPS